MTKSDISKISIVILSYNRVEELRRSLNELCSLTENPEYQLVIVDNFSSDGSQELLKGYHKRYPDMVCVYNTDNLGVSGGRNSGYRLATGELILNLDEDTHINLNDIQVLKNFLLHSPETGIVSPKVVNELSGEYQNFYEEGLCEIGNFQGACYMFRKNLLTEIGYLDEQCTFGGEELDYSIRARTKGYSVKYFSMATARHNSPKHDKGGIRRERKLKWISNYIRIHFKYFPIRNAVLLSARCVLSFILAGLYTLDIKFLMQLCPASIKAAKSGRLLHSQVPASVTAYYTNPSTRPDLGNIPITSKLANRFRKANEKPQ